MESVVSNILVVYKGCSSFFKSIVQYLFNMNIDELINIYMDYIESIRLFVQSEQFWDYHGYILNICWLVLSGFGIAVKKYSVNIHLIIFAIIDYSTMFLAGGAIFRILTKLEQYKSWNFWHYLHISLGSILLILMVYQHITGVWAYHNHTPNPTHRALGHKIVIYGRLAAICGWMTKNNIYYGLVSGLITGLLFLIDCQPLRIDKKED